MSAEDPIIERIARAADATHLGLHDMCLEVISSPNNGRLGTREQPIATTPEVRRTALKVRVADMCADNPHFSSH